MPGQMKRQQTKHKQQRAQRAIKAKIVMRNITHQISSVAGGRGRGGQAVYHVIIHIIYVHWSYNIILIVFSVNVIIYFKYPAYQHMCDGESHWCTQCHWSAVGHHCQMHSHEPHTDCLPHHLSLECWCNSAIHLLVQRPIQ